MAASRKKTGPCLCFSFHYGSSTESSVAATRSALYFVWPSLMLSISHSLFSCVSSHPIWFSFFLQVLRVVLSAVGEADLLLLRLHWFRGIELPPRRGCLSSGTRPGPSRPPCPGFMGKPAVDQFITNGKPRPRLVLHASSLGLASGARGPATPLGE